MRAIDPAKVLLIVNSDIGQSAVDAASYQTLRGLTPRTLAFNFGTVNGLYTRGLLKSGALQCQTAPYVGQSYLDAIAAYLVANDIDAVILSTYTPVKVASDNPAEPGAVYTLAAYAGQSLYWRDNAAAPTLPAPVHFDTTYSGQVKNTPQQIIAAAPDDWKDPANNWHGFIPHGRLGCADIDNANIVEVPLRGGVGTIYLNAVTQALIAEALDRTSAVHCFSETFNAGDITPARNKIGINWARQLAMPAVKNMGTDYAMSTAAGGSITINAPLFAMCLGDGFNVPGWTYNGNLSDSFTVVPGAWGYIYTSRADYFGSSCLYNGASAAVMTAGEPYSDGVPWPQELFVHATYFQVPLMLAHFLAQGNNAGSSVYGDPLYRPYAATGVIPPKAYILPFNF